MSRRSPFANLAREAERAERRDRAARPAHLRHLDSREYVRRVAADALEKLRAEQQAERHPGRRNLAGLSMSAWRLVRILRVLEGGGLVEDVRAGFAAVAGPTESFADSLAELAAAGLVEIGPGIGPDGAPAPRGMLALRMDVDLPADP